MPYDEAPRSPVSRTATHPAESEGAGEGADRGFAAAPSGRIVADAARCSNCRTCEMVCSLTHLGAVAPSLACLVVEHDSFNDEHPTVRVCPQCLGPECLLTCPRDAVVVHPDTGARVVDEELCNGCGACVTACHLDMVRTSQKAFKCDLCGGDPQCVAYCPQQCLSYKPHKGAATPAGTEEAPGPPSTAAVAGRAGGNGDLATLASRGVDRAAGGGRTGRILRVDLSTGRVWHDETARHVGYLGGLGIASRLFLEEVEPGTQPFDPQNLLVFMTGPFTGTPVPSSGRGTFYSLSPVGYPRPVCRPSSIGGRLGAELKYAGFDGLVVGGASERPVYLWVQDGVAEIRDAGELWGLDTFETQKELLRRHDAGGAVAAIGPSGENLGRMAAIVHGTGFASGIAGFGAVMGAKKLKAIGVRGSGAVSVADPRRLLADVKRITNLVYDPHDPPRLTGMRLLGDDYPGGEAFIERYSVGILACHGCPSACQGVFRVPGTPLGADCCVWPHSMAVGFTEGTEGWKAAWEVNSLVNRLGLSAYEVHQSFQFVNGLHDAGLIDEQSSGLPLDGDPRDLVKELAHQMAYRRGLGALLAEQLPRAAEALGGDAARFVTEVRGWPILMPWDDPRLHALRALLPATGSHFPHNEGSMFWSVFRGAYNLPAHRAGRLLDDDEVHLLARRLLGDATAADANAIAGKAQTVRRGQDYRTLADSLGFCTWVMPIDCSFYDPELRGDQTAVAELYSAVTGVETDDETLVRAAGRVNALERLQGIRHGFASPQLDLQALQRKLFEEPHEESPLPGGVVDEAALRTELERYYALRGWDPLTGAPTKAELRRLGADDLVEYLPS